MGAIIRFSDRLPDAPFDEVEQQRDFGAGARWSNALQVSEIAVVQREDMRERMEVLRLDLSRRVARDVHTVAPRDRLGAAVGRIVHVPVPDPGRFDQDLQSSLARGLAKGALGHGRTADIAKADEEHSGAGRSGHRSAIAGRPVAASRQKKFGGLNDPFLDHSQLKWQRYCVRRRGQPLSPDTRLLMSVSLLRVTNG
jgi:hypothetical protein